MNVSLKIFFLCLFITQTQILWAQPSFRTLQGNVYNAHHGQSLEGVVIKLYSERNPSEVYETVTNESGLFFLTNLPAGTYLLEALKAGFDIEEMGIYLSETLDQFDIQSLSITLKRSLSDLNSVVTAPNRDPIILAHQPSSTMVFDGLNLQKEAVLSNAWHLRYLPGIHVGQSGIGDFYLSMRGGGSTFSRNTEVRVDEHPWGIPAAGYNVFSLMPLNPLDIDHLEIVKGEQSLFYGGGAEQGILHFATRDPFIYPGMSLLLGGGNRDQLNVAFRYAGVSNRRLGYKISGRFTGANEWKLNAFEDDDQAALAEAEGRPRIDEISTYQLNSGVYFRIRPDVLVRATGGYQAVTSPLATPVGIANFQDFSILYGGLVLQAGAVNANLSYRQNNSGTSFYAGNGLLGPETRALTDKSSEIYTGVRFSQILKRPTFVLRGGADFRFTTPRTGTTLHEVLEDQDVFTELGAYAHLSGSVTRRLNLSGGLRVIAYDLHNQALLAPGAGVVYTPVDHHFLRANYSVGWSRPSLFTHYLNTTLSSNIIDGPFEEQIRGVGGEQIHTFEQFATSNTFTFLLPDAGDRQNPQNPITFGGRVPLDLIPLAPVYEHFLSTFQTFLNTGGSLPPQLNGATASDLAAFTDMLNQLKPFVRGTTQGESIRPVGAVVTNEATPVSALKPSSSRTIELGYSGHINNRLDARLNLYYVTQKNVVSSLEQLTPYVFLSSLESDLSNALSPELEEFLRAQPDAVALLQRLNLDIEEAADLIGRLAASGFGEQRGFNETPAGIIQSDQQLEAVNESPTTVTSLRTFRNIGTMSYWGLNAYLLFRHSPDLHFFITLSTLSNTSPVLSDTNSLTINRRMPLNAPPLSVSAGTEISLPGGFLLHAAGRFVDSHPYALWCL